MKLDTMNQMFLSNYIEYFELYKDRRLKEKEKYLRVIEEKSRGWHIGEQELVPIEAVKEMLEEIYGSDEE